MSELGDYQYTYTVDVLCKFCGDKDVVRYGKKGDVQYFMCKACGRKFADNNAPEQMRYSVDVVGSAINMFYEGLSVRKIQRHLQQDNDSSPSPSMIYNWIVQYSQTAISVLSGHKSNTCGTWIADETVLRVKGKKVWFWDVIDEDSRFLLASHLSAGRTTPDAIVFFRHALARSSCPPHTVITDKLQAYMGSISTVFKTAMHQKSHNFATYPNTNLIERFHGTIKDRIKVMRGLKSMETAKLFTDGWLIHYNFFRPHQTLFYKTPAQKAGISYPYGGWKDIVEEGKY